jgi:hypothetical protein
LIGVVLQAGSLCKHTIIMTEIFFELPLSVSGPLIILLLVGFGLAGLNLIRRYVLPRLEIDVKDSEFSGALAQCVMVFYGLTVGLIAVNVFQTHSEVSNITSREATSLAALYRDVSSYPEPVRSKLQAGLRGYTEQIINEAWPLQQRGKTPTGGVELMNTFQVDLTTAEPATEAQKLLFAETLSAYNRMIDARRARVASVSTALPGVMWLVIVFGAAISLTATFFFRVNDARLHGMLVGLLAMFVGLVIFVILALDRPYHGDLGVGPEPYQLIYEQLMKK